MPANSLRNMRVDDEKERRMTAPTRQAKSFFGSFFVERKLLNGK